MALEKIGVVAAVENIGTYLNDINRLNKATDSSADSINKASKSSESMSKALKGLGSVVAGLGLAGLFAGMVKSAGESEDAIAALDAVIKSTGGSAGVTSKAAQDLATSLQKTTRFSDEAILSGESMLLTFTNIGKDVFPRATKAVLDYAQKFGSVEQASIAIGKALQDPISGVTSLRRVGVMLSDQQEKQIKDFMAVGNVAGAQAVILKELEKEFGGLAVAAGQTFPGKLDILKNKFDDILETAGGKLIPKLSDLMDTVGKFLDQLGPDNTANLLLFAGAIGAITLAAGPLGTALTIILSPIGAIIGAVAALGLAFQTNFLGIRDIVTGIWQSLQPIIQDIVTFFQQLFSGVDVGAVLADLGWRIKHALELMFSSLGIDYRIVDQVFSNLNKIVDWFTMTAIPTVLAFITDTIVPGIQSFIDTLVRIWTDVSPYLMELYNWFVTDAFPFVGQVITDFQTNIAEPFIGILSGLWSAVQPALSTLYDWFVNTGLPKVKEIVNDLWQNILKPLVSLLENIWKTVSPGLQAVANFFIQNGPEIGRIIGVVIGGAFEALLTIIQSVIGWIGQAISKLNELLGLQNKASAFNPNGYGPLPGVLFAGGTGTSVGQGLQRNAMPKGFADGGAFGPGTFWTGEHGPELVTTNQSGFIFPNGVSQMLSGMMAQAAPAFAPASSYAYNNTYNQQQSMGDVVLNGVQGTDDAIRRYALLRAMGRVR